MNLFFAILLMLTFSHPTSRDYYFSATGNDQGSGTQDEPYKTIGKFNALALKPGDNIYFKRGDAFYGSLTPKVSGTISQPIYIGAYGTGTKPIITGLQTLTNWTSVGGGKYETIATLPADLAMVTLNDVEQAMGRYPNSEYLNFESHNAKTSITDLQFINQPNWTGAELVARTNRYIIDRTKITAHASNTLTYSPALSYEPQNGFGYFIQKDIRTLDQMGEWYYSNKKLTVYFGTVSPASLNVKAAGVDNVININNYDNIILDGLAINGGNSNSVYLYSASNITVKNCDIAFSGIDGISANSTTNLKVENCTVASSNNIGINLNSSTSGRVTGNRVTNSGMLPGMGQNHANKSLGIRETGRNNVVMFNEVRNSGYIAIRFGGDYALIQNNLVDRFNLIKDDGAGLYTTDNGPGRKIIGNIVLNGIGAAAGTSNPVAGSTHGIYLDDDANDVTVIGNTVANVNKSGILLHNAHEITVDSNTLFNNPIQLYMSHNMTSPTAPPIRNNVVSDNIFFSKTADQASLNIYTVKNDVGLTAGAMDNNVYCRPLGDNFSIRTQSVNNGVTTVQDLDVNLWGRLYGKDGHSFNGSKILPFKVDSRIGDNKAVNGSFIKDIKGITFGTTGTSATKTWISNGLDAGTLQVDINSPSKKSMTTVTVPIGAVSKNKKYVMSFSVRNSKDTFMYAYARQAGSPYKVLSNNGIKSVFNIGPDRKEIQIAFQPPIDNLGTSIFLETPAQTSRLQLDNVKVYEADVNMTNPEDSIRFIYNDSQIEKRFLLNGVYTNPQGIVFPGEITLQAYESAVLTWKGNVIIPPVDTIPIPPDTIPDVPNIPSDTFPKVRLVNNSPDTITTASISLTAIASAYHEVKKIEIFINGKIKHTEWIYPYEFRWENIPAGNYEFKARVVDKHNNMVTSVPVLVLVRRT